MFQSWFVKIDEFSWWDIERISTDAGTQFTSMKFQVECQTHGVHLTSSAPEHNEINGQVRVTWKPLRTLSNSFMVHVRVLEEYIHFLIIYIMDQIFLVVLIKDLVNKDNEPTMPFKFVTGTKPSV